VPRPASPQEPAQADQAVDQGLLESVLRQTEAVCNADDPIDGRDVEAVRAVARRHRGVPFALDPVLVELVQAVLRGQLQSALNSPEAWRAICVRVAQTLFEDPASHDRLRAFWARLSGGET
jgi:hypothetical protein